jgi:hypothetical protein
LMLALLLSAPALPCSLCGSVLRREPLTQEYERARAIVYGRLANPKLNGPGAVPGSGTTELHVEKIVRADAGLGSAQVITLPRYLPILDPKEPPRWVIFFHMQQDKLEATGGRPLPSLALLDYLQGVTALTDRRQRLLYSARHFATVDAAVADEAFLEFARATDQEVSLVARELDPEVLRGQLRQPALEPERLSLFAYLLGACGQQNDADFLRELIQRNDERCVKALEGLLAGYITLRPDDGWRITHAIVGNEKEPFLRRFAAIRTLRFFHNSKPEQTREQVLRGLALMLPQGEMADMAINDLRAWKVWDLTAQVLAQYGKPSHDSPIVKNSLVRYALACPRPEARTLVERVRREDPQLVRDLEEDLSLERTSR